jgi:hypothetical protein
MFNMCADALRTRVLHMDKCLLALAEQALWVTSSI